VKRLGVQFAAGRKINNFAAPTNISGDVAMLCKYLALFLRDLT
jgi:hypothetical protein